MQQPILKREEIDAQLHNIFDYPLTVVVAAMGYGKTTSVKNYLEEAKANYAWLSVGDDETSPQYIWDSFTRQLAKTDPDLGNPLNALGFPIDAPQRDRVVGIIADYAYSANIVLVIDDYHLAHSPELDRLLERIVRSNIDGLHLVIISRTRPELKIEELRLKGYCYLLKSKLFEMSKEDVKEYFKLFGQDISDDISQKAHDISEGWITAVYLMVQRYSEIGKVEPGRNIEDLIETAIMSRYTPEETRFLISLSILHSFTARQAVYVTKNPAAGGIIHRLSSDNSLIPFDERIGTYKMHHILSNYLHILLEEQFTDFEIKELYRRSGEWHIQNGDVPSGLRDLLKAGEYDLILDEFEKPGITEIMDRDHGLIIELFEQIPEAVKFRHPISYLTYAEFYLTGVDMEEGAILLSQIEQYYQADPATPGALRKRILGEVELIKSFLFFNDVSKMHECHLKAHQLLDGHSSIANKNMIFTFGSPHTLYLYHREPGKLGWFAEYTKKAFSCYQEVSNGCGAGFEYLVQAEYHLETADLAEAEKYAHKTIYKAESMDQFSIIICANLTLARICAARGKFAEALEEIADLTAKVVEYNSPILSCAVELCAGYIGGIIGESQSFAGWLKSGDLRQSEILYQGMAFNYIVHAKSLLLEENYIKLEALCGEMRRHFSIFNNLFGYLHSYIMDSAAEYKLYEMEKAKAALGPALEIGRADGIILPFAEYGLYILDILKVLQEEAGNDAYLDRLVMETARYSDNLKLLTGKTAAGDLTKREREVLRLVAEGQTNREIAAGLYLAEITVRKNITSIYRKLGVEGRAAAVKKAVELKLI